ncbi:MAG TPA: PDGLE domain-containing protein [bacterium]|nr:PDGLE domain-containing protein [bacterium]
MLKHKRVILFLFISVILAFLLSPFASSSPDGLEWVAGTKGFIEHAESFIFWKNSWMPDYQAPFISNSILSTSVAGLVGVLVCFAVATAFFFIYKKRG